MKTYRLMLGDDLWKEFERMSFTHIEIIPEGDSFRLKDVSFRELWERAGVDFLDCIFLDCSFLGFSFLNYNLYKPLDMIFEELFSFGFKANDYYLIEKWKKTGINYENFITLLELGLEKDHYDFLDWFDGWKDVFQNIGINIKIDQKIVDVFLECKERNLTNLFQTQLMFQVQN